MTKLVVLLALALSVRVSDAGPPSNPAFLGIEMQDARALMRGADGCVVISVTAASGAEAAGLRINDVILGIDGVPTGSCQQLSSEIISHAPGDLVKIEILRNGERGERMTVKATLSSRAEILHQRF
ncbi:MAG: PDZ domain-containing protein, partial [Acidobacteriota bacterium]